MTVSLTRTAPGIRAARFLIAKMRAATSQFSDSAAEFAEKAWPDTPGVALALKSAVGADTLSTNWQGDIFSDFLAAVRPNTVLDRLPLRRVPFATFVPRDTAVGFGAAWVGSGAPIPTYKPVSDSIHLDMFKAAALFVWTGELRKLIRPADEIAVRDAMVASARSYYDRQFLDPSVAAVAGVSPASITNGATAISQTGTTAAAKMADLTSIIDAITTDLVAPSWVMHRKEAIRLAMTLTTGGALAFPDIHAMGGSLLGIPVVTSADVPEVGSPTARPIILVDADSIALADDGNGEVGVSKEATLQMDSAPSNNAATGTGTAQVSMFQTESWAFKHVREINWTAARSGGVAYMLAAY